MGDHLTTALLYIAHGMEHVDEVLGEETLGSQKAERTEAATCCTVKAEKNHGATGIGQKSVNEGDHCGSIRRELLTKMKIK